MNLSILYRGPLSSCNYGCWYCPFAKRSESRAELQVDRSALERFVRWIEQQRQHSISVLFTPWGEGLIRKWYQQALVQLTQTPHVERAVIQTNISCQLDWVEEANKEKLALWTTYHPTETTRGKFVQKCRELDERRCRFSVGVVGLKENFSEIAALRRELPEHIYLWVNAFKRQPDYYMPEEIEWLTSIDPYFPINNQRHQSLGKACRAGDTVISVDGQGTVRRCHFIKQPLGNLYTDHLSDILKRRPCTNETCGCHIGYVHMDELELYDLFEGGVLERIPVHLPM
ncbi:MAG: STM4011 family radical SAM protein [Gemmataceae bacterium]